MSLYLVIDSGEKRPVNFPECTTLLGKLVEEDTMSGVHKVLDEFLDFINFIVQKVCLVLMVLMTGIVLLQVFARVIPGIQSPNWTEELSRYVMIYIAFIGASNGIRQWNNVGVDFVLNKLPKIPKLILNLIIRVAVLTFWCVVVYLGIQYFPKVGGRQYSASMGFPILYAQASLIIGGILCAVQTVGQILNLLIGGEENA